MFLYFQGNVQSCKPLHFCELDLKISLKQHIWSPGCECEKDSLKNKEEEEEESGRDSNRSSIIKGVKFVQTYSHFESTQQESSNSAKAAKLTHQ